MVEKQNHTASSQYPMAMCTAGQNHQILDLDLDVVVELR